MGSGPRNRESKTGADDVTPSDSRKSVLRGEEAKPVEAEGNKLKRLESRLKRGDTVDMSHPKPRNSCQFYIRDSQ